MAMAFRSARCASWLFELRSVDTPAWSDRQRRSVWREAPATPRSAECTAPPVVLQTLSNSAAVAPIQRSALTVGIDDRG